MKTNNTNELKFAFFGTTEFSVIVLNELKKAGFVPSLIVTAPDRPKGRKLIVTAPPVKVWAEENNIEFIQPESLGGLTAKLEKNEWDVFIVFSYGKIIPRNILDIPKHGIINLHPSLLPKLRGPSPIKSAILKENETGVTIIKLDNEMDHGPILAQRKVMSWGKFDPPYEIDLETKLTHEGGKLLAEMLPDWILGKIKAVEQDHDKGTFCQKIEKEDGEINLDDDPEANLRKIRAFHIWPTAYFFHSNKKRVIIKKAHIAPTLDQIEVGVPTASVGKKGKLVLDRVVPEGKREMSYEDYLRGSPRDN